MSEFPTSIPRRPELNWSPKKTKMTIIGVLAAIAAILGLTTFYTVQEQEHAAIIRLLGKSPTQRRRLDYTLSCLIRSKRLLSCLQSRRSELRSVTAMKMVR